KTLDRLLAPERQRPAAVVVAPFRRGRDTRRKLEDITSAQPLGIANEGLPPAQVHALVQGHADTCRAATAFELRCNHPGVVEYQYVAGAEKFWQVARGDIEKLSIGLNDEHPRCVAR